MAKVALIVMGVIILIATFFILEIAITPNQKSDIQTANSLCTAQVNVMGFTVPIGSWGQRLLGKEADCQKVHYMILLIDYGFIGYIFGGFLLFLGLILGWGKKEHHEEQHNSSRCNYRHCGECGSKLEGHEKHCPECGKKV